ncbi:MAG: MerR family transcriptional regulator [Sphingomicrobium sp.]
MKIGELASAAATTAETIRHYERIGLLPKPERTKGNYRTYSAEHFERLDFIRKARRLGFEIADIRTLMDLSRASEASDVDQIAADQLAAIEDKITQLRHLKVALRRIVKEQRGNERSPTVIYKVLSNTN